MTVSDTMTPVDARALAATHLTRADDDTLRRAMAVLAVTSDPDDRKPVAAFAAELAERDRDRSGAYDRVVAAVRRLGA